MGAFSTRTSVAVTLALVLAMVLGAFVAAPGGVRAAGGTVSWMYQGSLSWAAGFDRNQPVVVSDGAESVYIFYLTTDTSSGTTNINVTKLSIGTGILGTPEILFDEQVNDVDNVVYGSSPIAATIGPEGNLYVAWTRSTATLSTEIYVSTSTDGGVTWQPAVRANAPGAAGEDIYPAIVAAPNGTVYVAWTQAWFPFVNITVSQSTNEGNTFSGYTNASGQDPPGYAIYPSLGVDSQGRVYMAYQGLDFFSMTQDANLTWSDDGITWTAPLPISGTAGFGVYPQVLVDHADRVHAFWLDYRGLLLTGALTVWHSMSADRGATWSFGSSISEGAADPTGIISVAAHLDEIVVTWPASSGMANGISSIASADAGRTWGAETFSHPVGYLTSVSTAADQNGTFYAAVTDASGSWDEVSGLLWYGPPSAPVIASVTRGTGSLSVAWSASPEPNVAGYEVYRSPDGVTFEYVASVGAGVTSYTDSGLADGTYWYAVSAVGDYGVESGLSRPMSGTVGPTVQELIDSLQAQIAALQAQLAGANASNAAEVNALQAQIAALQQQLTDLQGQLNAVKDVQTQQATQTFDYVHLGFEILVVALLAAILLFQLRRPKAPKPAEVPPKPEEEL